MITRLLERRWARVVAVYVLRFTPLSWRAKRWIVWLLSPRFGLGVHAVIADGAGRVLTLRSSYSGRWQLPGGGVQYDETLEQAVRREVREELGLELEAAELVETRLDVRVRGVVAVFRARLGPGELRLSEEHTAWRYASPAALPPFYRRCAERVLEPPVTSAATEA